MADGMLNARLAELVGQCVEEYIKTATPVASSTIANKSSAHLSSATIRNDLRMLEQLGYLRQVHTSGGRVPTTLGYKAYIESLGANTFAGDLINDLAELARVAERINRKISGSGSYPLRTNDYRSMLERRQNIHLLLGMPDLEMSAFYLIIKERADTKH